MLLIFERYQLTDAILISTDPNPILSKTLYCLTTAISGSPLPTALPPREHFHATGANVASLRSRLRILNELSTNSMQSSSLPAFPVLYASFKANRSKFDSPLQSPSLDLSQVPAVPAWAALYTPPMSGSPTQDEDREIPQIAGHRRKRSDTPPTATTAALVAPAPSVPTGYGPPSYHFSPQLLTATVPEHSVGGYYSVRAHGPFTLGLGASEGIATSGENLTFPGHISPRATRKQKAHVASACVNCKKKHLRCDAARPCRRCIQSGKEVGQLPSPSLCSIDPYIEYMR